MSAVQLTVDAAGVLQVVIADGYDNSQIVRDAATAAKEVESQVSGKLLRINGRQTVPLCYILGHAFGHLVPAIAVFDPKLGGYVVVIVHGPDYQVGQVVQ